jgi:hypothetical protein
MTSSSPDPELVLTHAQITKCDRPEALFGSIKGMSTSIALSSVKHIYRRLAAVVHSDKNQDPANRPLAHEAFSKLSVFYSQAISRINSGTYGTDVPTSSLTPAVIRSSKGTYAVSRGIAGGDLSKVYLGDYAPTDGGPTKAVILKVARHADLNLFLVSESAAIKALDEAASGTQSYRQFIPTIFESFRVKTTDDPQQLQVNVFSYVTADFRLLPDVFSQYPSGIDPRHFVWIFSRLLTVLSFSHSQGIVHGAVLPPHIFIQPVSHAIHLIDWCFAGERGKPLLIIPNAYKHFYPPEVGAKQAATSATDIYMAAMCMCYILGSDYGEGLEKSGLPPRFTRLLTGCLMKNPARRTSDAWALYLELQSAAEAVFGPRRYVKLEMA